MRTAHRLVQGDRCGRPLGVTAGHHRIDAAQDNQVAFWDRSSKPACSRRRGLYGDAGKRENGGNGDATLATMIQNFPKTRGRVFAGGAVLGR
jgi:hypothetical protein